MSQRSQVSRIALRRCSQNIFVFVFVFVFVNLLLVMSCLLITLNKCVQGHKSLGLLLGKGSKVKKEKKLKKLSFRYVRVAENLDNLVFFSPFFSQHTLNRQVSITVEL